MICLLVLIYSLQVFGNKYCADSSCQSCTSGYYVLSKSCLKVCPSGYFISGQTCLPSESQNLFLLNFLSERTFNLNSIGPFSHPSGYNLSNSSQETPTITLDRGLYFFSSSVLIANTSWIMSPTFCFSIFYRAFYPGIIFKVFDESKVYLSLRYNKSIIIEHYYTDGLLDLYKEYSWDYLNDSHGWANSIFRFVQGNGAFYGSLNSIGGLSTNGEFRMDSVNTKYMIGSQSNASFQGFVSYFGMKNNFDIGFKNGYGTDCLFGQYLDIYCKNVSDSCEVAPHRIRSSCDLCYSSVCSKCHGYLLEHCEEFSSLKNLGKTFKIYEAFF